MATRRDRVLWSGDAETDLLWIWHYGSNKWSPAKADDHLREIKRSCDRLFRNPKLGKARDELSLGIRAMVIDPHVAFYRVTGVTVEIVRVLHQHEDVEVIFH
jgi:toxin ParE1/3/4